LGSDTLRDALIERRGEPVTRREWLAAVAATPLVRAASENNELGAEAPSAPVAIGKASSYDDDVTGRLKLMFDQMGGIDKLVRNKTVTIKLNLTGPPTLFVDGRPPQFTHWCHPAVAGAAAYLFDRAGAKRVRFVESGANSTESLESYVAKANWDVAALRNAAKSVEFENTVNRGKGKKYVRMPVGSGAYMFPAWDVNEVYGETDVLVSLAKLKNHAICGVTLSMKNLYGCVPLSIYGGDAGDDEPNENPRSNRGAVGHTGTRAPAKCSPGELSFGTSHDPGYRMPRVISDLVAAMPVHLAIIDGVESQAGAELPRANVTRPVKPGVLIAGLNPVCTDAVATALMGYNPRASRGEAGFPKCDNQLVLAEQRRLGTTDLRRIDVRGVSVEQALYRYSI
jgi:uncharacterized protein (DUF362 family)